MKNKVLMYLGALGALTLGAILLSIRQQLLAVGPWVLGAILAALGLLTLYYTHKLYTMFRSNHLALQRQKEELAQQKEELAQQKQTRQIEAERWQVERAALILSQQITASRIYPDTKGFMPMIVNVTEAGYQYIQLPHANQARLNAGQQQPMLPEQAETLHSQLPTNILYEDIRHQVPAGHILVGIGSQGVETKPRAVGACVWIVGLSGTGKTSTTVLRVNERAEDNHVFLGVDPHWFKDDSLYHAIYETLDGAPGPYASRFAMPMAKTPSESLQVYRAFLGEFQARKSGQRPKPWRRITLLSDEVGAQMDKATATTPEEKEIIELLPSIARICGQEARNFEMGGIFISQQATGLAWLRKVALMVIVHQLLQESEKKLATNNDPVVMQEMKMWPIGRTYVFGVGFGTEGPRTVQQPYFKPRVVEGSSEPLQDSEEMETLQPRIPNSSITSFQTQQRNGAEKGLESNAEKAGNDTDQLTKIDAFTLKNFLSDARRRRADGEPLAAILKDYGLPAGGRMQQDIKEMLDALDAAGEQAIEG